MVVSGNIDTTGKQRNSKPILPGMLPPQVAAALQGLGRGASVRVFQPRGCGMDAASLIQLGAVPPMTMSGS